MLPPATAEMLEKHGHVTEDDEGRRKNRALVKCHDQLIALKFPHLVGDGLHLKKRIAEETT